MEKNIFGERLELICAQRGYTKRELAELLGTYPPCISRYITGQRTPDTNTIVRMADVLGVSIDWLFGRDDEQYQKLYPEVQEFAKLYTVATADDRRVVDAVLRKYKDKT